MNHATVFRWYNLFAECRESANDDERSGRPCLYRVTETTQNLQQCCRTTLMRSVCLQKNMNTKTNRINFPEIIDSVIRGNDSWWFAYDPETKRKSVSPSIKNKWRHWSYFFWLEINAHKEFISNMVRLGMLHCTINTQYLAEK